MQRILAPLFVLIVLASLIRPAHADLCAQLKPRETRINIDIITPDPHYDFTKSRKDLTNNAKDRTAEWLKEHKMETLWSADQMNTNGTAHGGQAFNYSSKIYPKGVDRYGAVYCTYFDEINIAVFYRTLIQIASDFPRGSCAFNDILEHELRHHNANKAAVEKYIALLKKDIYEMVAMMEAGQTPRGLVQKRYDDMQQGMRDAIEIYIRDYVSQEMDKLNAQIDTPEEYARTTPMLIECAKIDGHKAPGAHAP